ncbi:MAG TPA: hypothetical protein VF668_21395 [Pyrinomonadaceae bacterium]|jgi:hypothetical protein
MKRLRLFRRALAAALAAGMLLSRELWFPSARTFPRVPPLAAPPGAAAATLEWLLSAALVAALVMLAAFRRPKRPALLAAAALAALVSFDVTRLQPWVYQYLLLLVVLALHGRRDDDEDAVWRGARPCLQLVVASLYVWGGVQKLNFSFTSEVMPALLSPLRGLLPWVDAPPVALGVCAAAAEALVGCGLLFPRARRACVWAAAAMHASVVALLAARGYNSVVWAWNAALVVFVFVLFRRDAEPTLVALAPRREAGAAALAARALVVAAALLPALSFKGLWDMNLSGALYSGNTAVAVVRVGEEVYEKLPPAARRQVFRPRDGGALYLPLFEWAMAELNVPPYPEPWALERAARGVCGLAREEGAAELLLKGRPAILDGSYGVARVDCARLGRQSLSRGRGGLR